MSGAALWIVGALYAVQAGVEAWQGRWPIAMVLTGYVIANAGLIAASAWAKP